MSSAREKLSRFEIVVLRWLLSYGGALRPIRMSAKYREPIRKLWRKGVVEIWWRTPPSNLPTSSGPFYALSSTGAMLAAKLFDGQKLHPAPRGFSGAGQGP